LAQRPVPPALSPLFPAVPLVLSVLLVLFLQPTLPAWSAAPGSLSLPAAAEYSQRHGERGLIVLQDGKTLLARHASDFSLDTPVPVLSITKTLAAIAAWQGQGRGWWKLRDPVSQYLPGWADHGATLEDLLGFSSGLPPGSSTFYRQPRGGIREAARKIRPIAPPRRTFHYGPASYEVWGEIFTQQLKQRNHEVLPWLERELFASFSGRTAGWRVDAKGDPFFSTGARLSLRQMARFGELIRRDGRQGWRRVWPAGLLRAWQEGGADLPMYHLGMWRNRRAGAALREIEVEQSIGEQGEREFWANGCLSHAAPKDLLALIGSGGQRIYIVPSQKLVIARVGRVGTGFRDREFLRRLFGH
jgi:CubicO group peptidase (beta-lactamase class C family)